MSLKRSLLAAYASPALPVAALGLPLIVYLPPYYAGELGLGLAVVGTIFFLVRAIDLPLDPLLGHLMDRTRTRVGRYRPWFVAGALLTIVACWFVFMARPGISAAAAFAFVFVLYLGYSTAMLAHLSWGATLTGDYHERSRVYGWLQAAMVGGMLIVLALPPLAAAITGKRDAVTGIQAMGWYVILMTPLVVAWALARVPEGAAPAHEPKPTFSDMWRLTKNPLLRRLLLMDLFIGLGPGTAGAMFFFYFEHRLGFRADQASLLLLFYFFAGFAMAPLWMRLAMRAGKHRAFAAACFLYAIAHGLLGFLPVTGILWHAAVAMLIAGAPYAATIFLPRAILADVADAEAAASGVDSTGLYYAVLTTTSKIAHAIPVGLVYPFLQLIGFEPKAGAVNTPEAVLQMTTLFVAAPVVLTLVAVWIAMGWRLDARAHAEVQATLAARRGAPAE